MRTQSHPEWRINASAIVESAHGYKLAIGHTFKLFFKSARDSIQYSGAFLVAAAVSHYFFAFATTPLLVISGTIFATRTVERILNKISFQKLKSFRITLAAHILDLDKTYPQLATIVMLFALAISPVSPPLSITTGIAYGIYMGLRIDNQRSQYSIPITIRRTYSNPGINVI